MKNRKIHRRTFELQNVEMRAAAEGEGRTLVGYAALFDTPSQDMGFVEIIRAGAFTKTIKENDIRALWNHDDRFVLGRNKAGTLHLSEDERGLLVAIDLPDAQWAQDLAVTIERGDVNQMSFSFRTIRDAWTRGEDGQPDIRELLEVRLYEVSPVTFPAYEETEISVRALRALGDEDLADEAGDDPEDTTDVPPPAGHPSEVQADGHSAIKQMRRRLELAERF